VTAATVDLTIWASRFGSANREARALTITSGLVVTSDGLDIDRS